MSPARRPSRSRARSRDRRPRWAGAPQALALALLLTPALAACTGDDGDGDPAAGGSGSAAASADAPEPVRTVVTLSSLTGKLGDGRKERVKRRVTTVVDGWLDAAYVGGDYPRADFADAFPGFTEGAAADATADLDLMSNQDIGAQVDSVTATKRRLKLDVLAVRGKAVTVTADVTLVFDTTGEVARSERVKGQLFLTYQPGGWQVFGYDMTKGETPT